MQRRFGVHRSFTHEEAACSPTFGGAGVCVPLCGPFGEANLLNG